MGRVGRQMGGRCAGAVVAGTGLARWIIGGLVHEAAARFRSARQVLDYFWLRITITYGLVYIELSRLREMRQYFVVTVAILARLVDIERIGHGLLLVAAQGWPGLCASTCSA